MEELQKRQSDMYEIYSHQSSNAEKILKDLEMARIDAEKIARVEMTKTKELQVRLKKQQCQKLEERINELKQRRFEQQQCFMRENETVLTRLESIGNEIDDISELIKQAEQDSENLECRKRLENEIEGLENQIKNLAISNPQNLRNLKHKLELKESEKDALMSELESLKNQITSQQKNLNCLAEKLSEIPMDNLKKEVDELRCLKGDVNQKLQVLSRKVDQTVCYQEELQIISKRAKELESLLSDKENVFKAYDEAKDELQKSESAFADKVSEFEKANMEYISKSHEKENLETCNADLSQNMTLISKKLRDEIEDELVNLRDQMTSYESTLKKETDEFNLSKKRIKECEFQRDQIKIPSLGLQHDLNQKKQVVDRRLKKFRDDLSNLRAEEAILSKQVKEKPEKDYDAEILELEKELAEATFPSTELDEQLQKETEAVLRAEAAHYLEKKQREIVAITKELAKIKLDKNPHIIIDEEAKEHLQVMDEPRKKIGQTIISMLEKKQIKKQL